METYIKSCEIQVPRSNFLGHDGTHSNPPLGTKQEVTVQKENKKKQEVKPTTTIAYVEVNKYTYIINHTLKEKGQDTKNEHPSPISM